MRAALLLLVALMVLVSLTHADPDDLSGGVFIVHAPPGVLYTSNVTTWCDSTYLADCEDQVNTIEANAEAVWFVLSAWNEEKSFSGVGASAWWEIVECLEAREGGYWVVVKGLAEGYFLIGATNLDAEGGVADAGAGGEIAADAIRYYYISYSSAPGAPTVTEVPSSGIATDSERAVRGEALAIWPIPSGGCVRLRTHV